MRQPRPEETLAEARELPKSDGLGLREMRDGRAVFGVALATLDEGVRRELFPHGLAQCARAAAVHDADRVQPGEGGVVDEASHLFARLLARQSAHVQLIRGVAPCCGADLNGRGVLFGRALA